MCMQPNETKDKFVELRAQGWSPARITTEINVSKRRLINWNGETITAPFLRDLRPFNSWSVVNQRLTMAALADGAVPGKKKLLHEETALTRKQKGAVFF